MAKLRLSFACWDYDRTRALQEGRIQADGIELSCLILPPEETFFRMLRHVEFDVAEMSLSSYVMSLFSEPAPFVAIPVFPSRSFRHSCIYVNANSGIQQPADLAGKRVGTPEYQMTAAVWIRGILSEYYGLAVDAPCYFTGGLEEAGRPEKLPLELPPAIRVQPIAPDQTLSRMLEAGDLDALYTARAPSSFRNGQGNVRRLFPDYAAVEREYYSKTGIFPIMHTVVIRRQLYDNNRWIAQSLCKAFERARQEAYERLQETTALMTMLPWLPSHVEETRQLMGEQFWPYGIQRNASTLETFLRYSFEQGLSRRQLSAESIFAPESLESFKI